MSACQRIASVLPSPGSCSSAAVLVGALLTVIGHLCVRQATCCVADCAGARPRSGQQRTASRAKEAPRNLFGNIDKPCQFSAKRHSTEITRDELIASSIPREPANKTTGFIVGDDRQICFRASPPEIRTEMSISHLRHNYRHNDSCRRCALHEGRNVVEALGEHWDPTSPEEFRLELLNSAWRLTRNDNPATAGESTPISGDRVHIQLSAERPRRQSRSAGHGFTTVRAALRRGYAHQQPRRTLPGATLRREVRNAAKSEPQVRRVSALTVTPAPFADHPTVTVLIGKRITTKRHRCT